MNQVKTRLAALALLDRAVATLSDDELDELIGRLDGEFRSAYDHVVGLRDDDDRSPVEATREAVQKGRINGTLERVAAVLSDACLEDCIKVLDKAADNPSEAQLLEAAPGLIERHGLGTVRLMLASAVAGEAQAAVVCTRLLKHHETLALPPAPPPTGPRVVVRAEDPEREAIKERRKLEKQRKQAEQRARREQAEAARKR